MEVPRRRSPNQPLRIGPASREVKRQRLPALTHHPRASSCAHPATTRRPLGRPRRSWPAPLRSDPGPPPQPRCRERTSRTRALTTTLSTPPWPERARRNPWAKPFLVGGSGSGPPVIWRDRHPGGTSPTGCPRSRAGLHTDLLRDFGSAVPVRAATQRAQHLAGANVGGIPLQMDIEELDRVGDPRSRAAPDSGRLENGRHEASSGAFDQLSNAIEQTVVEMV
jgi:hypothetical protein